MHILWIIWKYIPIWGHTHVNLAQVPLRTHQPLNGTKIFTEKMQRLLLVMFAKKSSKPTVLYMHIRSFMQMNVSVAPNAKGPSRSKYLWKPITTFHTEITSFNVTNVRKVFPVSSIWENTRKCMMHLPLKFALFAQNLLRTKYTWELIYEHIQGKNRINVKCAMLDFPKQQEYMLIPRFMTISSPSSVQCAQNHFVRNWDWLPTAQLILPKMAFLVVNANGDLKMNLVWKVTWLFTQTENSWDAISVTKQLQICKILKSIRSYIILIFLTPANCVTLKHIVRTN